MRSRETLGRLVREVWIEWAKEQPAPKPSWLVPWEGLSEPDKEVDRRIGERLANEGRLDVVERIRKVARMRYSGEDMYGVLEPLRVSITLIADTLETEIKKVGET